MVGNDVFTGLVRWIVLFPLAGVVLQASLLFFARRSLRRAWVSALALGPVVLSFLLSCVAFVELISLPRALRVLHDGWWSWFGLGVGNEAFTAELAFRFDPLSASVALVVAVVSLAICVNRLFSTAEDEQSDAGYPLFFIYFGFAFTSVLIFVLADNFMTLLAGWIGAGVGHAALVGFRYSEKGSQHPAMRSLVLSVAIDAILVFSIVWLFWSLVSVNALTIRFEDFADILPALDSQRVPFPLAGEIRSLTWVAMGIALAACGRAAQVPFSYALAGVARAPAPAAAFAIIHASMGVLLCCRLFFLLDASPFSASMLAWAGGATTVVAAGVALAQRDLIAILVASAISQFGMAFVAVGCGAYSAAIFQMVMTVIVFSLLVLCAATVIHALDGERDIRRMGGLNIRLVLTHLMVLIGVFSPAFFLAREQAIAAAFASAQIAGARFLYGVALLGTGLVSWALSRFLVDVFWGSIRTPLGFRGEFNDPRLASMMPLYLLAFLSVLGIAVNPAQIWGDLLPGGVEGSDSLAGFLHDTFGGPHAIMLETGLRWQLIAASLLATLIGFSITYLFFVRLPRIRIELNAKLAPVHRVLEGRDAGGVLERWVARPLLASSRIWLNSMSQLTAAAEQWRLFGDLTAPDRRLPDLSLLLVLAGALLMLALVLA